MMRTERLNFLQPIFNFRRSPRVRATGAGATTNATATTNANAGQEAEPPNGQLSSSVHHITETNK